VTRSGPRNDERGAALVEFVMVAVLLVFLLFGVLQVAGVYYVRNVVSASVADAARYAASAGADPAVGGVRAEQLIRRSLSGPTSTSIRCRSRLDVDNPSGLTVARVECTGRIRSLFLPIGALVEIDVVGHALREPDP
jgi:Flp pilus assembly protein TadG